MTRFWRPMTWLRPAPEKARLSLMEIGGWSLAYLAVGISGWVALQEGWTSAVGEPEKWTMLLVVAAACGAILLIPPVTLGRERWLAAAVLMPLVWAPAALYNLASNLGYFDKNFAQVQSEAKTSAGNFDDDRRALDGLRKKRGAIVTVRELATIDGEIAAARLDKAYAASDGCQPEKVTLPATREHCRAYQALAAERDEAAARDKIDREIQESGDRLAGASVKSEGSAAKNLVSLWPLLTAWTGIVVSSIDDLRTLLAFLFVEMGALWLPVGMSLASRKTPLKQSVGSVFPPALSGAAAAPALAPTPISGPAPSAAFIAPDVADVNDWLQARAVRAPTAMTSAAALLADFSAFQAARGKRSVGSTRFGLILGKECGLPRRNAGKKSTRHYLGVALKPQPAARAAQSGFLTLVSAGRVQAGAAGVP